jgi:hypothetical protein
LFHRRILVTAQCIHLLQKFQRHGVSEQELLPLQHRSNPIYKGQILGETRAAQLVGWKAASTSPTKAAGSSCDAPSSERTLARCTHFDISNGIAHVLHRKVIQPNAHLLRHRLELRRRGGLRRGGLRHFHQNLKPSPPFLLLLALALVLLERKPIAHKRLMCDSLNKADLRPNVRIL